MPTYPVGGPSYLAAVRMLSDERARKLHWEARRKAPRFAARVPEVTVRAGDPGALPDCGDENVMDTLDVIGDLLDVMGAVRDEPVTPTPTPAKAPPFAVGDEIVSLEPDHRGQRGVITNEAVGTSAAGDVTTLWVVDFGTPARRVLHPARMERVDSAPYRWAVKERRPILVGCVAPATCDCGHLDTLHDPTPGVGCTHRPYCLCVHPTGQRVPVPRLALAPPLQADLSLIVRAVR